MHSQDEDDVYSIKDGKIVWRAEHMANTFIKIMSQLPNPVDILESRFLDFGCGKGLFPKTLHRILPSFEPHLFDVSEDYLSVWRGFCVPSKWFCHTIPNELNNYFDIVTSLFALEHVPDPLGILSKLASLLSSKGILYIVIPNMYSSNIMDMVVVDHLQHYSPPSMKFALSQVGLTLIEEDHISHEQASIYVAAKDQPVSLMISDKTDYISWQSMIANSVNNLISKVNSFATEATGPIIVVGAGFIGTFVTSILSGNFKIEYFVDSNPYKQKKGWHSIPVISPDYLLEYELSSNAFYIIAHNSKMTPLALKMIPNNLPKSQILVLF